MRPRTCPIPEKLEGARLDHALDLLLPGMGLRARKRLIADGRILLDGRPAAKGRRVSQGQLLELLPPPSHLPLPPEMAAELHVLAQENTFAALFKPAGLHSASLSGREADLPSMEDLLPGLLTSSEDAPGQWRLLNRLDRATSGILLAGRGQDAWDDFRRLEDIGRVDKRYLAVLEGVLEGELMVDRALDTADRVRTRVLEEKTSPLRSTLFTPLFRLQSDSGSPLILAQARIAKGARHQIRAHAAHAGRPILGDALYGTTHETETLYLHHAAITLPGFAARCLPAWLQDFPGAREALPSALCSGV